MKSTKVVKVSDETFAMIAYLKKKTGLNKGKVMEKAMLHMRDLVDQHGPGAIYGVIPKSQSADSNQKEDNTAPPSGATIPTPRNRAGFHASRRPPLATGGDISGVSGLKSSR